MLCSDFFSGAETPRKAGLPSTRGRTEIELPDADLTFREERDDIQFASHRPNEVAQGADVHVGPAFER